MKATFSRTQRSSFKQRWKLAVVGGVLLVFLLLFGSPTQAHADSFEGIEITSSAGTVTGVTYNSPISKMINITNSTDTLTVSGASTQTQQCLTVNPGAGNTARLVLNGLTLNPNMYAFNAITVLSGTLELTIAPGSTNVLNSAMGGPAGGVVCLNGANLTIQGTGSLAVSGYMSPAIGAGAYSVDTTLYQGASVATGNAGDILIKEATITASSINGSPTAVIGCAYVYNNASNYSIRSITIANATIQLAPANGGAGIGGGHIDSGAGSDASVGSITI
jgi:hypothetical protein